MLNGVGSSETLAASLAVAVALVAALLVYRDARRHGSYHALSATGAVAIAGLVGYAVGGVVGLFVGTGYVLLLYLLSYPTTPTVDPEAPRGDAGENIASEEAEDTLSVIRVEVATYETLKELAERYDDVSEDAPEAELRSALRAKALSEVDDGNGATAADRRPERGLSDPDAPAARASEYGIEEWSSESAAETTERTGDYDAAEWTEQQSSAEEHVGDYGAAEWSSETDDGGETTAEREPEPRVEDQNVSEPDERPTDAQDRPTDDLPERDDELAASAQQWVAANVDQSLGVTVGEALDTSDVRDGGPEETAAEYETADWSDEEPPAETESDRSAAAWSDEEPHAESQGEYETTDWSAAEPPTETDSDRDAADWSDEPAAANGSGASATAEASASADADTAATNGGVWDTAGEATEQPQRGEMVFDNAVVREEREPESGSSATESDTSADSETADTDTKESSSEASSSDGAGDDDPFDGRGELYDGDDTYEEEEESRY